MDAIALLVLYGKGQRDFIDIDLNGVNFTGAILSGIDLQCSRLLDANLPETDLRGADLQYTFLVGANLQGANLQGANLKRANLQGANLKNANLKRANLTHANLEDANLQGANLQSANCRGANLKVANYEGVIWPSKKNLAEVILPDGLLASKKHTVSKPKKSPIIIPDVELDIPEILPNNKIEVEFAQKITQIQEQTEIKPKPVLKPLEIAELEKIKNEETKQLAIQIARLEQEGYFQPKSGEIAQEQLLNAIAQRQGQSEFRRQLLEAYNYRCAITGCDIPQILEAAYIMPNYQSYNHDISNGILLRSDIHTLFDLNLIAIEPDEKIHIHPGLSQTSFYLDYDKQYLQPRHNNFFPSKQALKQRYDEWMNVWVMQIFEIGNLFNM